MCGIHFTLCATKPIRPDNLVIEILKNRGPNSYQQLEVTVNAKNINALSGNTQQHNLVFSSSVLSLRGDHTAVQPFQDLETGSILCWNGEAWNIGESAVSGNDGETLFDILHQKRLSRSQGVLSQDQVKLRIKNVTSTFSSIRGPYAFIYYDALAGKIFFGRDCLGRRSLLRNSDAAGMFSLSSVCGETHEHQCHEIEANGVYVMDLWNSSAVPSALEGILETEGTLTDVKTPPLYHIPYASNSALDPAKIRMVSSLS